MISTAGDVSRIWEEGSSGNLGNVSLPLVSSGKAVFKVPLKLVAYVC